MANIDSETDSGKKISDSSDLSSITPIKLDKSFHQITPENESRTKKTPQRTITPNRGTLLNPTTPITSSYNESDEDFLMQVSPSTPTMEPHYHSTKISPELLTSSPRSPMLQSMPSPLLLSVNMDSPSSNIQNSLGGSNNNSDSDGRGRKQKMGKKTKIRGISSSASSSKERDRSKLRKPRRSDASDVTGGVRSMRSTSFGRDSNSGGTKNQTSRILRNLLILEESLRNQSRDQKDLRRQYTAFVAILSGLFAFASYSLFIDNYYVVSPLWIFSLRFLLFFIVVTFALFYLGGDYHRTIVLPRRFFTSTNKGLRQLNLKLVKVHTSNSDLIIDYSRTFLRIIVSMSTKILSSTGPFKESMIVKWITQKLKTLELRSQPRVGATDVKLILNPRSFPSDIREAWENYRDEFWSREGSKRREVTCINNEVSTKLVNKRKKQKNG